MVPWNACASRCLEHILAKLFFAGVSTGSNRQKILLLLLFWFLLLFVLVAFATSLGKSLPQIIVSLPWKLPHRLVRFYWYIQYNIYKDAVTCLSQLMTVAPHFRAPGGSYAPVMLARTVPKRFVFKGKKESSCTNFYVAKSSHLMGCETGW